MRFVTIRFRIEQELLDEVDRLVEDGVFKDRKYIEDMLKDVRE
jgi:hypothetical protein